MPKAYSPYMIDKFKGVNSNTLGGGIDDHEFTRLENFNPTREGPLIKRRGLFNVVSTVYGGTAQRILGIQRTAAGTDYLVFTDSAKVWRSALPGLSTASEIVLSAASIPNVWWGHEQGYNPPTNISSFNLVRGVGAPVGILENGTTVVLDATNGPIGTFSVAFKTRMWVIESDFANGQESRIWFSAPLNPADWSVAGGAGSMQLGIGDGDFNVTAVAYNDQLIVFKSHSTWVITAEGDPTQWSARQLHTTIGCAGRGSALVINGFIYFFSGNSVYRTDGTTFEDLGLQIKDKFNFAWDTPVTTRQCDAVFWDNKYILRIPSSATTLYVYDIYADAWTTWILGGTAAVNGFARYQEYSTDLFYTANPNNGKLMRMGDFWWEDNSAGLAAGTGTPITAVAHTKNSDFGSPGTWKRHHYTDLIVGGNSSGTDTLDLDYQKDTSIAVNNAAKPTPVAMTNHALRFPGAGRFRTMQHKLTHTGVSDLTIYGFLAQTEVRDAISMSR